MSIRSLPRYRGLRYSPKGRGEADGHGKRPNLRLRDYVLLTLIIVLLVPMLNYLVVRIQDSRARIDFINTLREEAMDQQMRRGSY